MTHTFKRSLAATLALTASLGLAACAGMPDNRTLYSTKQPVVERSNFVFDFATSPGGVPVSEQQRLDQWFASMDLRFGDRLSLDDASANPAVRDDVAAIAGRYGILLADGAPVTAGSVAPGQARIVVTRSMASVPGCPDWAAGSDANYNNATYANYGCSVNSNMAAMVANPEDLISGQTGTGETVIITSTKAIRAYRDAEPTGAGGLPAGGVSEGGN